MNPNEERRLQEELDLLERINYELLDQDTLILEQMSRTPDYEVTWVQRDVLSGLFTEVQNLLWGSLPMVESSNPDAIRPSIRSAMAKVSWEIKRIRKLLNVPVPLSADAAHRTLTTSLAKGDPRKVFVVHSRNEDARRAIFDLLFADQLRSN